MKESGNRAQLDPEVTQRRGRRNASRNDWFKMIPLACHSRCHDVAEFQLHHDVNPVPPNQLFFLLSFWNIPIVTHSIID